ITVAIAPAAASQYLVTNELSGGSTGAGAGFAVAIQAADAYGNPVTSYSGPATVTASVSPTTSASNFPLSVSLDSHGSGIFLANLQKVGVYTITVSGGSLSGSAGPVTVTAGAAVRLGFGAQPVSTPTGVLLPTVTVQVLDLFGNVITGDNNDIV